MAEKTLIEGIRESLDEELERDPTVFITGEDVGPRGGVFRATMGLSKKSGPSRIIDSRLGESSIVAIGVGAAMNGMRPVCEIQFADFIHPAYNQIVNEAARMYYRTGGATTVPMVIRTPFGAAKVTREGADITVYAYGIMHFYCQQAADEVAKEGIGVELVDLRTLNPLDKETVLNSFKKTGKALIVYEDNRFLGYGAEIAAILADEAFHYMDAPIMRLAGPDVPGVPYSHTLQDWFMPNPQKIAAAMRKLAAY